MKVKAPFSELTRREKFLVDNPEQNKNKGYGGYHKWYTVSNTRKTEGGITILGYRKRAWFWRDKPIQKRK